MISNKVLVVIDVQKEYLADGALPLWNMEQTLNNIESAIAKAKEQNMPIILVQHVTNPEAGESPFFNAGTEGVKILPRILEAAPSATIVTKGFIDAFEGTKLEETLQYLNADEMLLCGMMTQSCVNHTALSKQAENYKTSILADCCTTLNEIVHKIALLSSSTRVEFGTYRQI
jgi:nicotinamidase-related amidase